jgi:hypothetical protein
MNLQQKELPYRPFAFPQGEFFLKTIYLLPIRTLSVYILKLIFAVRLLVRGVTGFNKACPHLLSARLRQLKFRLLALIRTILEVRN